MAFLLFDFSGFLLHFSSRALRLFDFSVFFSFRTWLFGFSCTFRTSRAFRLFNVSGFLALVGLLGLFGVSTYRVFVHFLDDSCVLAVRVPLFVRDFGT